VFANKLLEEAKEATDSETENRESIHELHAKWEAEQELKKDDAIQKKITGDWRKVRVFFPLLALINNLYSARTGQ
jgi:hypothetical protein